MDNGAESYCKYLDGDDNGLVEIIRDYKDGLILFLNSHVKDMHVSEELCEDTFFKLAVKKPHFSPKYSFKTWLFTIGRNLAINYLKSKKHSNVSFDECEEIVDNRLPDEQYLTNEKKQALYAAMKKINTDYSQVLWLTYFEGFSNKDTAKIMHRNTRQIENLVYRAKAALKSELEREGFNYEDL